MLDMKNLSKLKYIYRIYESSDKILHLEKYPIIYINSEVVYFKMVRKQEYIHNVKLENIKQEIKDFYVSPYLNFPCYSVYYADTETNICNIFIALKQQQEYYRANENMINIEKRYDNAKDKYEKALKEYEAAKKQYEERKNS